MKNRRLATYRPRLEELESRLALSTYTKSTNWSGYAVTAAAGSVQSVTGSWVVPSVSGSGTSWSSSWVGIDGFNSSTVEQIGTDSDLSNGVAKYYAWYEMYPAYPVNLPNKVVPGDTMIASVTYKGSAPGNKSSFILTIAEYDQNTTNLSWSFTTTQTIRGAQRSSAEWIQEAPSSNRGVLPLAPFGTVAFSAAQATIGGGDPRPISAYLSQSGSTVWQIDMISGKSGAVIAATSGLNDATSPSSFTVSQPSTNSTIQHTVHHKHSWWWFQPNMPTSDQASISAVLAASVNGAMSSALPTQGTQGMLPSFQQPVLVLPSPNIVPRPVIKSVPLGAARGSDDLDNGDDKGTDKPAAPAPGNPATPANQLPPEARPEAIPAPTPIMPQGNGSTSLQDAAATWHGAANACFMEGRLDQESMANGDTGLLAQVEHGTTMQAAAGVLLTLGWGCYWSMAAQEPDGRRRLSIRRNN